MKRLLLWLAPPKFDDHGKSRQAELLNVLSIVLFVLLSLLVPLNIYLNINFVKTVNAILIALIASQVLTQLLFRKGYVHVAGLLLLSLSWVGITYLAFRAPQIREITLFAYVTILLSAGYMFGWQAQVIFGVLSALSVWFFAFYEVQNPVQSALRNPIEAAIYITALLLLFSFQIYYVMYTLKKALAESTREILARQQMEKILIDEQEKLNFALDAANMGTWSWDIETGAVKWSEKIESIFGMQRGEFDGQYSTYLSIIHPDDLLHVQTAIQRALDEKEFVYFVEHCIRLSDGEIRWLEGRGNVYRNSTGKPVRMAGTVVDITDRKRSEEALREAEENYRNIVENSAHGIFQSTPEGRFLSVNTAMARIYGYDSSQELIDAISAIPEQIYANSSDREVFIHTLEKDGAIYGFESKHRRKDRSLIWISGNARAVKDNNGKILYFEGTVEDITSRKEAELERERLLNELAAKNAELERFVYTVSHDLKSPLVTIVGFLGYLEDDFQTGNIEALHKDMDRISRAALKMQDLLNDLLDLSRIGRMMNESEVVSFNTLVNEALELTEGRLHDRGIQVDVEPEMPAVYGDARRLLELVQNLIDNAAKYMGNQPAPHIEMGYKGFEDGKPIFFVRDNGIGIAPEHHERIFGLFNKLDPNAEGTGIGLALVKRIVEYHGGRIWVESEAGEGATFLFTLQMAHDNPPESS